MAKRIWSSKGSTDITSLVSLLAELQQYSDELSEVKVKVSEQAILACSEQARMQAYGAIERANVVADMVERYKRFLSGK